MQDIFKLLHHNIRFVFHHLQNIDKSIKKGIAERIFWADLSTEHLYGKIKRMLDDPSYAENIENVSKVFRDQKETPLERAVWWTEWILRNPNAKHLRNVGADLNFFQRQSLDVLAVLFSVILFVVWITLRIFFVICKVLGSFILKSDKKKKE